MKGSLQKKHGKYYVVVYQKDENGKLRQKWIPTGISEKGRNQTSRSRRRIRKKNRARITLVRQMKPPIFSLSRFKEAAKSV